MKRKLIAFIVISTFTLHADWSGTLGNLTDEAKSVWEKQKENILNEHKDENLTARHKRLHQEHFNNIWEDVISNLEKGLALSHKIDQAPNSAFFSADKESIRKDFETVLDDIIMLLLDDNLLNYRKNIRETKESITSLEKEILDYREKKITAPTQSHLKTTKDEYVQKIADAKESIKAYREKIVKIKFAMSENFKELGINISPQQIDVLLARVDGDDIISMTLMMDVLKQITVQLLAIMQESGEELNHAKKYYGMHMVLLELVVYVQQKLINKIEHTYIPKIDKILSDTSQILEETSKKISDEESLQRRTIYYQNYEAQKLTFKVATLYKKNLQDELIQVAKARDASQKNLDLSKNTFQTVTLSSDLYKIISTSQEMMREVMKLQVPTIIPFENMKMKEKFQELTKKISQ